MYILPQKHKCNECGHEQMYGPHDGHNVPFFSTGDPMCPNCWDKFLKEHVGKLEYIKGAETKAKDADITASLRGQGSITCEDIDYVITNRIE